MLSAALHSFLLGIRQAVIVWSVPVGLVTITVAVAAIGVAATHRHRRESTRRGVARPTNRDELAAQAAELRRYAEEIAVAARRAADTSARRYAEWQAMQHACDAAWRAFLAADEAARRAGRATLFPLPETPPGPDELAGRERYLRRAATDAYRRGELSVDQLREVLTHRAGWDPRRHPSEHEARLRRIGRERLLHAYLRVSEVERSTWRDAWAAEVARQSLASEAFVAALRAHRAQSRLVVQAGRRRPHGAAVGRPVRHRWAERTDPCPVREVSGVLC